METGTRFGQRRERGTHDVTGDLILRGDGRTEDVRRETCSRSTRKVPS